MIIHFQPSDRPPLKLADVELEFDTREGDLAGLKLVGFAVWRRHLNSPSLHVTVPSRWYAKPDGDRRTYALLRAVDRTADLERLRHLILDAYAVFLHDTASA